MRTAALAASAVVLAIVTALAIAAAATPAAKPPQSRIGTTPVVVELFTSQGCSSCPPADAFLRTLARDAKLRGKIIPLAFHVDYWDRLGWRDPFSSRLATQRQAAYVRALKISGSYTPQIVVNGAREMVGSNAAAVTAAIEEASKQPPAGVIRVTAARKQDVIDVTLRGEASAAGYDLIVALYEDDVTTDVGAGENGGRKLVNDAIVRHFVRLAIDRGAIDKTLTIRPEPSWRAENLGVAAFLQERVTLKIGAAAVAR